MPMPGPVGTDPCKLANRWTIDLELANMLVGLDTWALLRMTERGLPWPGIWIQSGYRSPERQREVNPGAPNSLHTRCPAIAVDLRVGQVHASVSTESQWAWLGAQWLRMGGRWGGTFKDRDGEPAPDLNHFDLGDNFSLSGRTHVEVAV